MNHRVAVIAFGAASQILVGMAAGFVAYMQGIQSPDLLLIINLAAVAPLLGLAFVFVEGASTGTTPPSLRALTGLVLLPVGVVFGFYLFYAYPPLVKSGSLYCLYGATSVLLTVLVARKFLPVMSRQPRYGVGVSAAAFAIASAMLIGSFAYGLEFRDINPLPHRGPGILNLASDDMQLAGADFVYFVDRYEFGGGDPQDATGVLNLLGQGHTGRSSLGGPLISLYLSNRAD